ncbi:MAG: hypothetical protein FWC50_13640 [Planctomycetaceae bacterium]|nr:hypothetical protein [Planctomycetaceae bacterium]
MDAKVDMTYRFFQDDEPTDEQLLVIMQEVAEEARRKHEETAKQVIQNIEREYLRVLVAQRAQQG